MSPLEVVCWASWCYTVISHSSKLPLFISLQLLLLVNIQHYFSVEIQVYSDKYHMDVESV